MWQHEERRSADIKGAKGFALPGATRHFAPDRQASVEHIRIEIWLDPSARAPGDPGPAAHRAPDSTSTGPVRRTPDGGAEVVRPDAASAPAPEAARAPWPPDAPLPPAGRIRGQVTIVLRALTATARLDLDAQELEVEAVTGPDGAPLDHALEGGQLQVTLPQALAAGEPFTLTISYAGAPRRGLYFIGPSEHDPTRPVEAWTQGQDEDSRHWFPCFDYPNQKARTEVIAHVGPGQFALSNGVLVESREHEGARVFRYRQDTPHTTYLVTLVVGEYVAIEHPGAPVPVVSFVHPAQRAQGELTFDRTAAMVKIFSEKIGVPYPYPRYAQICVADFIFGGMENTSATTLTDQVLFDARSDADYRPLAESLIAHELAHQWWGDLLTCADWSHAWLNEGFATYFETVWREHGDGPEEAAYARLIDQEAYFGEHYRRPLVERVYEEPIDLFDRHLYEKGALVLHLIRFLVGDTDFWRVLKHYAEKHRGGLVESDDLRRAVLDVTGRNLENTFEQWVYASGHPVLTIGGAWDPQDRAFNLTVEQTQRGDRVPEVFAFPVDIELCTEDTREVVRVKIDNRKQVVRLPAPRRPVAVVFDKGGHIPKQVDVRLSTTLLRGQLERTDDVLGLIHAARTLAKRGEPAGVRAVAKLLAKHPSAAVRVEAARALKRVPSRTVKDALVAALHSDADPRVRRAAIRALAAFKALAGEIADVFAMRVAVETSDYAVADMMRTVGDLRAPRARAFLEAGLERTGHNHCIRAAAIDALAKLRDPSALPVVARHAERTHHHRVRESAVSTLGALGRFTPEGSVARADTRDQLVEQLGDDWLRVRMRAADALKALADRSAIGELREHAEQELDGRARRAMRLAERDIREQAQPAEELERLRDELKVMEQSHARLQERLEKLEARRGPEPAKKDESEGARTGRKGKEKDKKGQATPDGERGGRKHKKRKRG